MYYFYIFLYTAKYDVTTIHPIARNTFTSGKFTQSPMWQYVKIYLIQPRSSMCLHQVYLLQSKKLEKELDVRLFDRSANSLRLNECGRIFLKALDLCEPEVKRQK